MDKSEADRKRPTLKNMSSQVYLFNNEFKRAVIINAMLIRNDKAESTHSHPNVIT